jgi:hypothetical protein
VTKSNAARRPDMRNEEPYVERAARNKAALQFWSELYNDLTGQLGCSHAEAAGICAWVFLKAAGEGDPTSSRTRNKYRRRLSELAGEPYNEPGAGRPRGYMGTVLMAIAAAPIIIDQDGEDDQPRPAAALHSVPS